MNEALRILHREFVYVWYYFILQLRQIAGYWILGMVVGSLVSVFAKDAIHGAFDRIRDKKWGLWGVVPARSPLRRPFRGTECGIVAGVVVHIFYKDKPFFNFEGFEPRASHDTHPNLFLPAMIQPYITEK